MAIPCCASQSVFSVVGHLFDSEVEDGSVEAATTKLFVSKKLFA